ncbi:MAG: acetoin utilization protein AcuC [SAR202 cluster bacterium]|nr:acetoin utilization protein AcuC [SAR202 cluster bacterium]
MVNKCAFIYSELMSRHQFPESHPMKPIRLKFTYDLLNEYDAFSVKNVDLVDPREASVKELSTFHSMDYIDFVFGSNNGSQSNIMHDYNFNYGDNPIYEGIYSAAALSVGASIKGAEILLDGNYASAFNISGGLHHAMRKYAAGFCVFNDAVIAINKFLEHGKKVVYIDIDCHHGDGVQEAFYDSDQVLTISIHESGEFLFPGTGFPSENGVGIGEGFNINIPLSPFSNDEIFLAAFSEIISPVVRKFKPDVLVTQLGVDTHFLDPITHLNVTVQGFTSVIKEIASLSPGKWLALGGGGYEVNAVVRSWVKAFGVMSCQDFSNSIPEIYKSIHGIQYLDDDINGEYFRDEKIIDLSRRNAEITFSEIKRMYF